MPPFRFVHTADWQIGMMARGFGAAAEAMRRARIEAIRNVLAAAAERKADAILVAGDLFEDNLVAADLVEEVAGLLNDAARMPIYLIPGNHDPDTRDGIYRRPLWGQLREHVRVLRAPEPVSLADGVTLYPCPLARKTGFDDPTAWIPPREAADGIRIGLAHGTLPMQAEMGDDAFPIAMDRAERSGLDYLALGHWHSTLGHPASGVQRTWYSGTHETTRFGERDSGNAVVVTIAGGGEVPEVEAVRTGTLRWRDHDVDLDRQPLDEAMRELREMEAADRTLLRVTLRGQAGAGGGATLKDLLILLAQRFLHHQIDDGGLRPPEADDEGMRDVLDSPFLRQAAEHLQRVGRGEADGGADPAVARRAMQILQQTAWEQRRPGKGD